VLVNVTGGLDMTLLEVDEAANAISEQVDPEANIIFGAAFDPSLDGMIRVSVVATGMDGASIAAIEPKIERRPSTAPALRAETTHYSPEAAQTVEAAQPAFVQRAPEPVPAYAPQPALRAAYEEEQPDLYAAPAAVAEPQIVKPMTRIVDPMVAEAEDEPLFAEPAYEARRPRGGFLSLFGGRPRYDAPAAAPAPAPRAMASRGGALPAEAPAPVEQADAGEDLEIPSFLRRLAN
jgi:cell division protein FtsZ